MASSGAPVREDSAEASLEKIKRQLTAGTGRNLLHGPLLKRSETLRKWNERWVILDPTTGKMEYKMRRNEPAIKGSILFDASSVIALSPVNFQGQPKYDGCCFYVGTPQKKDYFLCAETPGAARAWVSTLQATQLVLKAHKEAVNALGSGSSQLGTVATVVAAANATALEASKEIEAAMKVSLRNALGTMLNKSPDGQMDDLTIMKETMRVKDEELQNLARELRSRDSTIKEIADKLTETADAAEAAASAAHTMDEQRRTICVEMERMKEAFEKQKEAAIAKLKESEEKFVALSREINQLTKERDSALQEAHMWRMELGKARERVVILEATVMRAEEKARVAESEAETKLKEAAQRESVALKEKEELLAYVGTLQVELKRYKMKEDPVFEEKKESSYSGDMGDTRPLTKHVDSVGQNVDKPCLSISEVDQGSSNNGSNIPPAINGQWNDIQATEATISDVREVDAPEEERRSNLDIPVVTSPVSDQNGQGAGAFHQP